ncbi:hypothetical protein [Paractinoplanes maris]|uniref:hypothetical protein n=1 Tax=Paractinoplanes maris TaxID=1734446 RepID=UPI002020CE6E|nr:hypothetical protein [Actinoplanes maris]
MTPRLLSTLLVVPLVLAGLAGCTDDDTSASSAATTAPAATESLPPAPTGAISRAPAGRQIDDAEICAKAGAAKKKFAAAMAGAVDSSGKVPPAAARQAFNDLAATLDGLGRSAPADSAAATGARAVSVELTRIADEPDPFALSEDPELEKAGAAFDKTCA